jgi:hypothetical protein
MRVNVTKAYNITFQVMAFEQTEGGMNTHCFGPEVDTIQEAIHLLESAYTKTEINSDYRDWLIVCTPECSISSEVI